MLGDIPLRIRFIRSEMLVFEYDFLQLLVTYKLAQVYWAKAPFAQFSDDLEIFDV